MTTMIRNTLRSYARGAAGDINEFTWEAGNDVREEAAEFGSYVIEFKHDCFPTIRHICRRKGEVSHFKGGNLNNAIFNVLNDSRNQFFAFLDCDMVPTNDFIQLTLPLFLQYKNQSWEADWVTGMCQAPQSFSNVSSNGSDDPLAQVQDFYWRRTMMHLDRWGIVHYYGTNVMFFRPALEDVIGWQYGVLSEDTPTGANVAALGWKTVYVDQDIATGLCKDNVEETLIQRKRWAMGNMMWWMLTSPFWKWFTTKEFQNPPFWDKQSDHYAATKAKAKAEGPRALVTETTLVPSSSSNSIKGPEVEDPETTSGIVVTDPGCAIRQERIRDWTVQMMLSWSYMHVKLSNQVAAFWFLAFFMTSMYMMVMAGESIYTPSDTIMLNVLFPALHFITTTTILYVIGPQSGMWRACQDRFAFAWVRAVAIYEACVMAMLPNAKSGPWNVKTGTILVVPPLFVYMVTLATWLYSFSLCAIDFDTCVSTVQSDSFFSANLPIQLVGLFLGAVIIVSMWPIVRCALSNILGYPMYKLRIFPAGSTWPYFLALSPLVLVGVLWAMWGDPGYAYTSISSLCSSEMCIDDRIAPSLMVIGCQKCGTTSLYTDMVSHFPQIDSGTHLLSGETDSTLKAKHFFDEDYDEGMTWYLSHYPNCSNVGETGDSVTVSADFTPDYLETKDTASRIHSSYSRQDRNQLRFVTILRDPVDRLYSYFHSSKKDGSLDLTGYDDVLSSSCLDSVLDCEDYLSITFNDWARYQLHRAGECEAKNPDEDLWPNCGTEGMFGGLYSLQVGRFLEYFDPSQICIVRFEAFTEDGPQLLGNLAKWLGLEFIRDGMTAASDLSSSDSDDDDEISETILDSLQQFYNPYTSQLYSLIADERVTFIDVIEKKDLF
uniref:Sulfotransferase domain-containing protein n=1 Tax=Octactis speculum TaxID=3111310 RepID=A0A7S2FUJ2_9STRA